MPLKVNHSKITNAPADPGALVDGPAWDGTLSTPSHTVAGTLVAGDYGLSASALVDTTTAANVTGAVRYDAGQSLTTVQKKQSQANTYVAPTVTVLTSGSGTYNVPSGVTHLRVRAIGGGGGGGPGGTQNAAPTSGGNTTFASGLITASGGGAGCNAQVGVNGGVGGAASVSTSGTVIQLAAIAGGGGDGPPYNVLTGSGQHLPGGAAGSSAFGGKGISGYNAAGGDAAANSGSGGGGGACSLSGSGDTFCGSGGGSGGYCEAFFTSPAASYAYAVGAGGSGGTASSGGYAGGNGAAGIIIVEEYYGA